MLRLLVVIFGMLRSLFRKLESQVRPCGGYIGRGLVAGKGEKNNP
jgi:hypothetical protein